MIINVLDTRWRQICLWSFHWSCFHWVFIDFLWHCSPWHSSLKINHNDVRGASYQWFKSSLTGRQQYTTIAHLKSDLCSINCGVSQGSVLEPILFLFYSNYLNQAILHSKEHHLADDTNFLYASHSLKK